MPVPHPIPDAFAELIAERLRLLAEPTRIRILDRLREKDLAVNEITASLGTSQQNVSKHLALLHRAGIVGRERSGNLVRYRITDASVFDLCEIVCGGVQRQLDELQALVGGAEGSAR